MKSRRAWLAMQMNRKEVPAQRWPRLRTEAADRFRCGEEPHKSGSLPGPAARVCMRASVKAPITVFVAHGMIAHLVFLCVWGAWVGASSCAPLCPGRFHQMLIEFGLLDQFVQVMKAEGSSQTLVASAWVVANFVEKATEDQIRWFVNVGGLELFKCLDVVKRDAKVAMELLKALDAILQVLW